MKYRYTFLFIGFILGCCSCEKALDQLKDKALDGLQFEISTSFLHQTLSLQVLDELTGLPAEGVELSVLRSDFSQVYTNSGSKTLRFQGGLLSLGTLKREAPSESTPRKIQIRYQGDNYFTLEEEYLLSDTTGILATVWMRPKRSSANVDVLDQKINAQRSTAFDFASSNQQASLHLDPYVDFRDAGGKITGSLNLSLKLLQGNASNKSYLESSLLRAPFRRNDGSIGRININPLNCFEFQVRSGSVVAEQLSYPAWLSIAVLPDVYNPLSKARIKAGDLIPAFWQSPTENTWQASSFATVIARNGKLEAHLPLTQTGRWVLGFMELWPEDKITEQCQVFIQVQANVPDTLKGVYYRGTTPVHYQYTRRASLNFMQVFPSCRNGQGFDLDALVRNAREQTRRYYLLQDSTVFRNITYQPSASVFEVQAPSLCPEYSYHEKNHIPLSINADEATEGWLYYQIGSNRGYRFMRLIKGINNLNVAYPRNPLFSSGGFYGTQAQFTFYYEEACQLRSSTRSFPVCEVLTQGALLRVRPSQGLVFSNTQLSINAACGGKPQAALRPTLPVYYRNACSDEMPYKKLGELNAGVALENLPLLLGERYDFKIQYGRVLQEFQGVRLSADSLSIGKFYTLSKNGRIRLHLGDLDLPEEICKLIR
jgi:hypothetical protein